MTAQTVDAREYLSSRMITLSTLFGRILPSDFFQGDWNNMNDAQFLPAGLRRQTRRDEVISRDSYKWRSYYNENEDEEGQGFVEDFDK